MVVKNGVLQNAVKEQRPLVWRVLTILFGQPHHAGLDQVQGRLVLVNAEQRRAKSTAFDTGEKLV
jgi:uncharacterized protein YcgL (UPF0745 family)